MTNCAKSNKKKQQTPPPPPRVPESTSPAALSLACGILVVALGAQVVDQAAIALSYIRSKK